MAENIVELLTDVADAIREKKGSTEKINAQAFAEEIKNLPSGGDEGGLNIGGEVFDETIWAMTNIKEIRFKDGVKNISESLKNFTNLESVYISSTVTNIALSAMSENIKLAKIVVSPDNQAYDSRDNCNAYIVTSSGLLAGGCMNTIVPIGVKEIGYGAFQKCKSLTNINLPEGITNIGAYAFYGCDGLTKVEFPSTLKSLQVYSFGACSHIKLYDFRKHTTIPTLGSSAAFAYISTENKIVVPDALYDDWVAATNWSALSDNIVKSSEYTEI